MNISWFEIIAQIINFFIILFILQKLLYKPVLNAMSARQERIQKSQIEADERMNNAEALIDEYDKKIVDIEKEKREILADARKQAEEKKENLLEMYKIEADNKRKAYLKEIEDEKERFAKNLRKNLGKSAIKIASHILEAMSSKELEKEIFASFILDLQKLDGEIPNLDEYGEETLNVHSARELSQEERETIESVLRGQIKDLKSVNFETDPSLILGYELSLQTYTVQANIKDYLSDIQKDIMKDLEAN
jgi:F-type H+-transporting ATPase subunit b